MPTPLLSGVLALAFGATCALAQTGEHAVEPGDTLEIFVPGLRILQTRLMVDQRGILDLPLAGSVNAAGKTLKPLRDEVGRKIATVAWPVETSNGPTARVVAAGEVMLRWANVQPVYVSGDVAAPGAFTFRPGFTVRQAIAAAGGATVAAGEGKVASGLAFEIIRAGDGVRRRTTADFETTLQPGDVLDIAAASGANKR